MIPVRLVLRHRIILTSRGLHYTPNRGPVRPYSRPVPGRRNDGSSMRPPESGARAGHSKAGEPPRAFVTALR